MNDCQYFCVSVKELHELVKFLFISAIVSKLLSFLANKDVYITLYRNLPCTAKLLLIDMTEKHRNFTAREAVDRIMPDSVC